MSSLSFSPDQLVLLHARLAELQASIEAREQELAVRDNQLKMIQANLLKAQSQVMELGDTLAARETALKNAEAGAPNLQRILDTQLARTNDLDAQLRSANDREAAGQLELAALRERMTVAEKVAKESIASAQLETTNVRTELETAAAKISQQRKEAETCQAEIGVLKELLAASETTVSSHLHRIAAGETARVACEARLQKMKSHWVWRATGFLHD